MDGVMGGIMNVGETSGQGPVAPVAPVLQVLEDQVNNVVTSLTEG